MQNLKQLSRLIETTVPIFINNVQFLFEFDDDNLMHDQIVHIFYINMVHCISGQSYS